MLFEERTAAVIRATAGFNSFNTLPYTKMCFMLFTLQYKALLCQTPKNL